MSSSGPLAPADAAEAGVDGPDSSVRMVPSGAVWREDESLARGKSLTRARTASRFAIALRSEFRATLCQHSSLRPSPAKADCSTHLADPPLVAPRTAFQNSATPW